MHLLTTHPTPDTISTDALQMPYFPLNHRKGQTDLGKSGG